MTPGVRYEPGDVADVPTLWSGDVVARPPWPRPGRGPGERVVGGVGWEVCQRLLTGRMAFERPNTYGAGTGVTYEPEALKLVWEDLVAEAGAALLLRGLVTAAVVEDSRVVGVVAETRSGPRRVSADTVVDASGDAEVAWRAGAVMDRTLDARRLQPATATFRIGGVADNAAGKGALQEAMRDAVRARTHDLSAPRGVGPSDLPARRQARQHDARGGLRRHRPVGVDRGRDRGPPPGSGVRPLPHRPGRRLPGRLPADHLHPAGLRESRRMLGRCVLTRDDVIGAAGFADAVARCGAPVEDHAAGAGTRWEYVGSGTDTPTGKTYGIPFRCLLPRAVDGLVVAGRCLSATHDAHASVRSMGQCMAMGQAAGAAAALAAADGVPVAATDVDALRARLRQEGALL